MRIRMWSRDVDQRSETRRAAAVSCLLLAGSLLLACASDTPEPKAPSDDTALLADDDVVSTEASPALKDAIGLVQEQQFAAAKPRLLELERQEPKNSEVPFYLGVALEGLGDADAAIAAYKRALALNAKLVEASVNLSAALLNSANAEDSKAALEVIDQGLTSSPDHEGLLNNRAMAQMALGDTQGAALTYEVLLKKQPDDAQLRALYAEALARSGNTEQALKEARALLASTDREVLASAADLLGRMKAFDGCVVALDKAIQLKDASELRVRRGVCQHGLGEEPKALADFQTATDLDPKSALAFYYLGQSLLTAKNQVKAKDAFNKVIALAGESKLGAAAKNALKKLK